MKTITMLAYAAASCGLAMHVAAASDVAVTRTAVGAQEVAWQTDIAQAWQATQQHGRPLLIFVTRDQCYYCTKMKEGTYASAAVGDSVRAAYVPLLLDGSQPTALLRDLNVKGYPSTFVISPQAVVLDRIDGYVTPEVLVSRLNALRPRPPSAVLARDP